MKGYSVCIVTYNSEDKIGAALSSIYAVRGDIDVYVSDNASSDGTVGIVRRDFPGAKVIENKENRGFGAGNNAVLPMLESELHFIINPDITVSEDVFGRFGEYFDSAPDVVMAVPRFLYEDGTEQFTPRLRPRLRYMLGGRLERFGGPFRRWREEYTMKNRTVTEPVDAGFCSGCFICVRTEVFRKIGGFDERYFLYSEDADLTREAQRCGRTVYCPQISVTHSWERAYMRDPKYFLIQISSMLKYFLKWRGRK